MNPDVMIAGEPRTYRDSGGVWRLSVPMLRAILQPLYDSEWYPKDGLYDQQAFVNVRYFTNGQTKRPMDTNLYCDGCLGTPLEMDVMGLALTFNPPISEEDHVALLSGSLDFIFGGSTVWLQVPIAMVASPWRWWVDRRVDEAKWDIREALKRHQKSRGESLSRTWGVRLSQLPAPESDQQLLVYPFPFPSGMPRRVTSNESFRVRLTWPDQPRLSADVRWTVWIIGKLYAQL